MKLIRITQDDLRNIISESINILKEYYNKQSIDWDDVDMICFSVYSTYDQDELDEILSSDEFENDEERQEAINEYKKENTNFNCDFYDLNQELLYNVQESLDMLDYEIPEDLCKLILDEFNSNPQYDKEYRIDDILRSKYGNLPPEEAAKHMFQTTNEYLKGMHGFILEDGTIVLMSPGSDHNEITSLDGVDSKWDFIMQGNVSLYDNNVRIGAPLTYEQKLILRKLVSSYDEVYVDLFDENGREHTGCFYNASPSYFCNVFDRYYREGILPEELM